jgi:hypothetical protein
VATEAVKGLIMPFKTFPEFGKELRRPFEVHENCYDCAEFYEGCKGWRASRDFACEGFNRLPNVMPGTYGQRFPPSRRSEFAKHPWAERNITPGKSHRESSSAAGEDTYAEVAGLSHEVHKARIRACGCGAILPKGRRLCDPCRIQNRRQTKRGYMRTYMKEHRPATIGSDPHVPSKAAGTLSTQAGGGDLLLTGLADSLPPLWSKLLY